jgi:hypothetical protein
VEQFKYDHNSTYENNFDRWKIMNDKERSDFGEELYSQPEAKRVFDSMYGSKLVDVMNKLKEKYHGKSD